MRLHLKINDVEGQDERKRHILLVDDERHRASIATRQALDFYHDVLGIEKEES